MGNGIGSNIIHILVVSYYLYQLAVIILSVSYALRDWLMKTGGKEGNILTTLQKEHCKRIGNRSL